MPLSFASRRLIPKGAKTCEVLAAELYGISQAETKRIMAPSMKYIKEGEKYAEYEC